MVGTIMRQSISLHPPVYGQWAIFNPPGHPKLAYDFLTVDDGKSPYKGTSLFRHLVSTISVESTLAWNQPVLAVMEGTVVAASDGMPDRHQLCMAKDLFRLMCFGPKPVPPFSTLGGNYVILNCGGAFPLYAHLQNGSVLVRPGDIVRSGDVLGRVGNSGASLQPHLHFQVMATPDPFPLFKNLVPFVLDEAQKRRAGVWQTVCQEALSNGDHLLL
ncbi:MAG: M23 family metallopeptidase [Nitrospira sp.]|nr:MAG: M23 family metallopeptidase [Nitrospira sp.]